MKTISQASKILGIARSLIWYHIRMGHIKAERVGFVWIIPDEEVERLRGIARSSRTTK